MDAFLVGLLDKGAALGIPFVGVMLVLMWREMSALTLQLQKSNNRLTQMNLMLAILIGDNPELQKKYSATIAVLPKDDHE